MWRRVVRDWSGFENLKLVELDLIGIRLPEDLEFLTKMPELKKLDLNAIRIDNKQLDFLRTSIPVVESDR